MNMSKREKRLARIRANPRNTSLVDFEALIGLFGRVERRGRHPKAIIGNFTMPYRRENPMKVCYVLELLDIIDAVTSFPVDEQMPDSDKDDN